MDAFSGQWFGLLVFVTVLLSFSQGDHPETVGNPIVSTPMGKVEGLTVEVPSIEGSVDVFYGIPFAKPPVGDLRFRPPEPAAHWTGTRNCTFFRPSCIQELGALHGNTSEDCLYLNVYRPSNLTSNAAVFFWIYGGGFRTGAAILYDARALAILGQMIVVTIDYRLGAFGFLATGSATVKGNAGLLDQHAALSWVAENIAAFGGDKDMVTIVGESAGGASVSLQLMAPPSRNLFRRAISESGSATCKWATYTQDYGRGVATALSKQANCGDPAQGGWDKVITCLQGLSSQDILAAQDAVYKSYDDAHIGIPFSPVPDGTFLPEMPLDLLRKGNFKKTEYLNGFNANEFAFFLLPLAGTEIQLDLEGRASVNQTVFERMVDDGIRHGVMAGIPTGSDGMIKTAIFEYTNWSNPTNNTVRLQEFINFGSDHLFTCPLVLLAESWVNQTNIDQGAKLFSYELSHTNGIFPTWAGVPHSADLVYVFGFPFLYEKYPKARVGKETKSPGEYTFTEADKEVSRRIINMWTAFVKNGDPSEGLSDPNIKSWPPYTQQSPFYLDINDQLTVKKYIRPHHCSLWTKLMPKLLKMCPNNSTSTTATPQPTQAVCTSSSAQSSLNKERKWEYALIGVSILAFVLLFILGMVFVEMRSKLVKRNNGGARERLLDN